MFSIPPVPDKEYFTISELSQITQVPKHTLRYWEKEFNLLRPARTTSGRRSYRKNDVENVFKIKDLLYNKKYTIAGVKKFFSTDKRKKLVNPQGELAIKEELSPDSKFLKDIKEDLKQVLNLLRK